MTARAKALVAVAISLSVVLLAALAWLYTRPVVTVGEIEELRARAARLSRVAPELDDASVAPPIDCTDYLLSHPNPTRGAADEAALETLRSRCSASFGAAWAHQLASPEDQSEVIADAGRLLSGDAEGASMQMESLLRTIWSLDSIVRSGRTDLGPERLVGLQWTLRQSLIEPLTEDEASHLREMWWRVREHHPHRLHRPELLALWFLQEPSEEPEDEALEWVCSERVVAMAEALAGIGCGALTTHACFDRVNQTIDALERSGERPAWAGLLPARHRRQWDAQCPPLTEPLRELVRRAVESEITFSLLEELIAHGVSGCSLEEAMARPAPTFDGEPLARHRSHVEQEAVVIEAPSWALGNGHPVLTLLAPRHIPEGDSR